MIKTAIILSVIHLCYYAYFQIISDFIRMGMMTNNPHVEISKLISQYKVSIRTFQKNGNHRGFAWFKTIYLNENLLNYKKKARNPYRYLKWVFHHEHYHLMKNHKLKTLLMRLTFSFVPLLFIWHWSAFVVVYVGFAYLMHYVHLDFENKANAHANKIMTNHVSEN